MTLVPVTITGVGAIAERKQQIVENCNYYNTSRQLLRLSVIKRPTSKAIIDDNVEILRIFIPRN